MIAIACVGCPRESDSNESRSSDTAEAGSVTVYLEPAEGLPRLHVRIAFFNNIDPNPHVEPIATALIASRRTCYPRDVPVGSAHVRVELRGKKMRANPRNELGDCLAKALDGQSIDDAGELTVELHVTAVRAGDKS